MCQAYHAVQRESGVYISTLCIRSFADQFKLCLFNLFFIYLLGNNIKSYVHSLMRNRIAVEHEKHEDGLDRKGEVVQSFNIIVCP